MKKIIVAVAVVLVITVIGCAGIIGYHNKYYEIGVCISYPIYGNPSTDPESDKPGNIRFRKEEKSYFCFPSFASGDKAPEKQQEFMETVSKDIREYVKELESFEKPYYIEAKYENVDGKTVVTYKGEVTNSETGELEPYEKVFMYPFIVTKNIQNLNPADTNYFNG